jgi:cellulose synthase/poly-beta-1,6-N-acetylglucosamine synthase-like glycosyltransferase
VIVLHDWLYWLSLRHPEQLLALLSALLLMDGPRYGLSKLALCLCDCGRDLWRFLRGRCPEPAFSYCPSVCVVIAAYNEGDHLEAPLRSVWGSYPRLEIIVVDDGSSDATFAAAQRFARDHVGVHAFRMPERSGKSPALNLALQFTKAEVIVGLDADAELEPSAIWEIVQPLADPTVGLVSGAVLGRSPFTNLLTWMQAYEFLHTVFAGRILMARLGLLGIASGAFSAFRRSALDEAFGWDEGSSADLDVTLRIRKSGHQVVFAPYAECYTDMMTSWKALIKQRLRWDRSIFRNYARKHIDMAYVTSRNFRLADFAVLAENWFFTYFCMYGIVAWAVWFCLNLPSDWWQILVGLYLCYQVFELIQVLAALYYTNSLRRDLLICAIFPLIVFYQMVLLIVRLVGTTEEIFLRKSYLEKFTPDRVRNATWHW